MSRAIAVALAAVFASAGIALAQVPASYPAEYAATIAAGNQEGKLVVYSTTDSSVAAQLLRDFAVLYPAIRVDYIELNSGVLYKRYLAEAAADADSADIIWASSMDGQMKLAAEGLAATYASPEIPALPKWAVWQNQVFGTTYEPVAFIYNKELLAGASVPQDHSALLGLLNDMPTAFKGRIAAYDPEKSGVGYLLAQEDIKNFPQAWDLFRAFGKNAVSLQTSAEDIMEGVAQGEQTIGYGVFASYAIARARRAPNLGLVIPKDYAVIVSRVALITARAKRPNAARLFLDYLLSHRGQSVIADHTDLYALRSDVAGERTIQSVTTDIGDKARPIAVDLDLLEPLKEPRRRDFSAKWRAAIDAR